MKRNTFFLLALAAGSALTGCGDDNTKTADPKPKSKSELLLAKPWNLTSETETTGNTTEDVSVACDLDDVLTFSANKVVTADNGAKQCDPNEDRLITGEWDLSENDTKLTLTVFSFPVKYTVEELTDSKLVLSITDTSGGQVVVTKTTFTGK